MADAIVINKANTAPAGAVEKLKEAAAAINPRAAVYVTDSSIVVDAPDLVQGKRVVLIEDGPTLTHGGMKYGAGKYAAEKYGAAEIVDPRLFLVGSMLYTYRKHLHLGKLIPAMGYYPEQIADLEASINAVPCDAVVIATPMDLRKVINIHKPATAVSYAVEDREPPLLRDEVAKFMQRCCGAS